LRDAKINEGILEELKEQKDLTGVILPDGAKVPDDQDFPAGWK
jgi:hypothetical protein